MSRNSNRNNGTKYGICTNMDPKQDGSRCSLCQKKEKQAIRSTKEFVCAECGEPLTEVTAPPPPPPLKLILTILAVILFVVAIVIGLINKNAADGGSDPGVEDTIDTTRILPPSPQDTVRQIDTVYIYDTVVITKGDTIYKIIHDTIIETVIKTNPPKGRTNDGTYNLGWGRYEGPCRNGMPEDGILGEIKIIKDYSIDLKDGRGSTLEVKRGDVIVNPKFKNGKFMLQGELHRTDGTRRVL